MLRYSAVCKNDVINVTLLYIRYSFNISHLCQWSFISTSCFVWWIKDYQNYRNDNIGLNSGRVDIPRLCAQNEIYAA